MTTQTQHRTSPEIGGMGHSVKRKEDPRFIRGAGEYIEDVVLPGMLWMDIVRSPYAHATIKSIDASEALKIPGVLAVITGADLEKAGLHWMPTLAGDKQMVLPTTTVMYQAQEVAAVVATERHDRLWLLKTGYDEALASASPGMLALQETVAYSWDRGLRSLEFLGDSAPWTRRWTRSERPFVVVKTYPHTPLGAALLTADAARSIRRRLSPRRGRR